MLGGGASTECDSDSEKKETEDEKENMEECVAEEDEGNVSKKETGEEKVVRHSTPKHQDSPPSFMGAVVEEGHKSDDTIPDAQFNFEIQTDHTIESSRFLELDKEGRECMSYVRSQNQEELSGSEGRGVDELSPEHGDKKRETASDSSDDWSSLAYRQKIQQEGQKMYVGSQEQREVVLDESDPRSQKTCEEKQEEEGTKDRCEENQEEEGNKDKCEENQENDGPKDTCEEKKEEEGTKDTCENKEEEERGPKDVFDFYGSDDSFDDKTFVPPSKKQAKLYSPSKTVLEINCPKEVSRERATTPPEIFKARRDPEVEERWRQGGGHTPDKSKDKSMAYGVFNKDQLSLLVHILAKSKNINLESEPLKPPFFKDLVRMYGDVPGGARLAPYTSHQYVMRKWREYFCCKKVSKTGSVQADTHKYEWPQERCIPCQKCSNQPNKQDSRDQLLQTLSDHLSNKDQQGRESTEILVKTGQMEKGKEEKVSCPHCQSHVGNLKRHMKENCRSNPNNLAECPRCTMMVMKRSLTEHQEGRKNKKTGTWVVHPCKGIDGEGQRKEKCPTCGILVKHLRRHVKERHQKKEVSTAGPSVESTGFLESRGGKRAAESVDFGRDAKKQKQGETPMPQEPKEKPKLSPAEILNILDDWVYKYMQKKSMEETGGINQEEMIDEGISFMANALGIDALRPPYPMELDGDCLYNSLSFLENQFATPEEIAKLGSTLRKKVIGECIDTIKRMTSENLRLIQAAAAAHEFDELKTRDELVEILEKYEANGKWDGSLGDLMPQLVSSFSRTPLFIIAIDLDNKQTTGYFVNPRHIFNQPGYDSNPRVVIRYRNHYNPLIVPNGAEEALREIFKHADDHQLQMAGIRLPTPFAG